jgi:hypothetical protein
VGVPRATLYRWERQPKRRSSRPHHVRSKNWPSALVRAVERLRQDYPMWCRAKLGPLARAEGFAVSEATVWRIIQSLVARGVVGPVPTLRRRRGPRRWSAKRRFALRLPRDVQADRPGSLVQLDTVFVNVAPDKAIKHFRYRERLRGFAASSRSRRSGIASANRRQTRCLRFASRSSSRPPLDDWLPPPKSTVSFLRRTDGRSNGDGVSSVIAAVAQG